MTTLSGLIAQALERARLFDAEHARSQALQRALLPRQLPELPAVSAAASIPPADGVWTWGATGMTSSRCRPTGLPWSSVTSWDTGCQKRSSWGAYAPRCRPCSIFELPPDEIMAHLNDLVSGLGDDSFVTCLYAIYDPTTSSCTVARAGHPPPAVVCPDGTVHFAQAEGDPPLGVAGPPFEVSELQVPDGALLAPYTDGLVDSTSCDPA